MKKWLGYRIEARTAAVKEEGPKRCSAEAGGGGRRREPEARWRSPNLHRFGRGYSGVRETRMIFFSLSFFSCFVFRSLSLKSEFVWRREAMGMESDLGSGDSDCASRGPWRRNSGNL
jgi:hypothetical protein